MCRVRDNARTVSQRDGIQGVNVGKHCCSHSTGTAEAAMQTHSHCSLCLGMLPLRLKDNNSFSLSLQCVAFLWRWVPVSTGCVDASYNRGLLYPWLCSLYSSSAWKGKISLLKELTSKHGHSWEIRACPAKAAHEVHGLLQNRVWKSWKTLSASDADLAKLFMLHFKGGGICI